MLTLCLSALIKLDLGNRMTTALEPLSTRHTPSALTHLYNMIQSSVITTLSYQEFNYCLKCGLCYEDG